MSISTALIGHDTLALECARMLRAANHAITCVVTRHPPLRDWAEANGIAVLTPERIDDLAPGFDWLLSIANLDLIPAPVLARAARGAVNFHDGPLPAHAGLNAPVWALLEGCATHGVTWHLIDDGIDTGDILEQRIFEIAEAETALSLNTRCFAAALDSFPALLNQLETGLRPHSQDPALRSLHRRADRPAADARIDFSASTAQVLRLVRALDHGDYPNPVACPKLAFDGRVLLVQRAEPSIGHGQPGEVLAASEDALTVATGDGAVRLEGLRAVGGTAPGALPRIGQRLDRLDAAAATALTEAATRAALAEPAWRAALAALRPAGLAGLGGPGGGRADTLSLALPPGATPDIVAAAFGLLATRLAEDGPVDLAEALPSPAPGHVSGCVPLRFDPDGSVAAAARRLADTRSAARRRGGFATDLPARMPGHVVSVPRLALGAADLPGAALVLDPETGTLRPDPAQISAEALKLIADRLRAIIAAALAAPDAPVVDLPVLPDSERALILHGWNATEAPVPMDRIDTAIARQAGRNPDATALIHEDRRLSHAELDAASNRVAQVLRGMGAGPGTLVGLHLRRSVEMMIGALAILKAGAGYLPLDPDYPADRLALYVEDSGAAILLTETALVDALPPHDAQLLVIDADPRIAQAPATAPETGATPEDLAYLIYTSGSTGRPKGVMIEHRNVANFFAAMDARIAHDPPGVWLAVTSMSFDISVLELFWTLARGFTVVIQGDAARGLVSGDAAAAPAPGGAGGMAFSLYYWGNDDASGGDKYRLLLDGARFADANGFDAVWTPERHFHAFGGPYPNPSVTGAAVAAVTRNIAVRAGSCVAPLHHPARIAEEWAVIDNLTGGRAGLAIASGWQPDDFVLRPENTPPANKPAMLDTIDQLRRLWRGEAVEFPRADGTPHPVITQPRPISKELPIWVTTAGNPDTWREAGRIGANVLTHLLGQTIDEVRDKIALYHAALREAGHDPAAHRVTLMLHTYVADTRDAARDIARGPMKDYLRSAAGLIKQYAWAFPAFKKPQGVDTAHQLDLGGLEPDEMDAILDFAFERYFEDSGLFGTVEDCLDRVAALSTIGVDEIACLIDYGIDTDTVLDGLRPLAQVLTRSNAGAAPDDWSIAAQIRRHEVSHLQCTPSMARMLVTNDDSRAALAGLSHLLVGGEALPGALVADLSAATGARIENMYGPTETTIWSTSRRALPGDGINGIGTPVANTTVYVLDDALAPLPVGVAGELWIGGAGVARGYWQRPDLTADRFRPDPFRSGQRIYRTGDLVRWRADGSLDFLGRADHQVKLRGHRIELGEIEAALDALPGIRQSVVIAREDVPGLMQLVGYVTAAAADAVDEAGLRAALEGRLPAQMVPARIVALAEFPLTPNRKIDRNALPRPVPRRAAPPPEPRRPTRPATARPGGDTVTAIAAIWSRILGVDGIGPRDSFFDLGGHSLLAVQAHRDIRDQLGAAHLGITDIFRYPQLGALAARVDAGFAPPQVETPAVDVSAAAARGDAMARRRALRAQRAGRG